jgi:hypothetical protein
VSTYKPLGQKATAATTAWDLYTPSVQAAPSTLSICNRGSTQTTFRVAVRPGGATLANDHYIAYDATAAPVPATSPPAAAAAARLSRRSSP